MRDCFWHVSPARSRSPLGRCRVLHELGDSKAGEPQFLGEQETLHVQDRVFGQFDSYARRRLAQWPALLPDSRNRGHTNQRDAVAGICDPQNYGFAGAAKEDVPTWSGACADIEHGSRQYLNGRQLFQKAESTPHLSPLPLGKGRGGKPFVAGPSRTDFVRRIDMIRNVFLPS